ncbi:MAG TPA: ABC transporter substrate-binding protein [Anaerolineaceae bacterium]|nr:ABC transporter substrate-binding protein [Anaerolineaceae bacterium]
MKRICIAMLAAVLLASCVPQAASPTPTALTKIRLPAGYIPDVQFASVYVALEKGYFQQAGLDVTLDYSQETDGVALVGTGTLQFALASGEQVLLARAQGLPIVYVLAWYQQYPVGVTSSTREGIHAPADLKGKKIGLPVQAGASYIGLRALLQAGGLKESDVTLESIGFNQVEALVSGRVQAAVIYINNEPIKLAAQNFPANTLRVADYMQLVGNGLITNEDTIRKDPGLVQRMAGAMLKGMQDALANPDAAYTICLKYVENLAQADQKVQKQVLTTSMELWKAPHLGQSDPKAWNNMQTIMLQMGQYKTALDVSQAFTNQFVP